MAYPTGMLSLVLEGIDRRLVGVKTYCTTARTAMAAGSVVATVIVDLHIRLKADHAALDAAKNTPGLAAYAQEQKNNGSLDVAAEFMAVLAAMADVVTWIEANFPKDGSGFLLRETWGANGPVDRSFTTAATAGLRTELDALISTIS